MIKTKNNLLFMAVLAVSMFLTAKLYAHGYVESPASRSYQGSLEKNTLGYSAALAKYGAVINEPQSLEYKKGFPELGPPDGHIASANGVLGDFILDLQTADRWKKTDITTGVNSFIWKYRAYHSTAKWHYYITKQGWDPNKPLERASLELIGTIEGNGAIPTDNTPHKISVPNDRKGYHVILAVWDVADTVNAFYSVIDVNVMPSLGDTTPPNVPSGLSLVNVSSSSAKISWTHQSDALSYMVFRNDQFVKEVFSPEFQDQGLLPNTDYSYSIQAKDAKGVTSAKSTPLMVKTSTIDVIEKPTIPDNLHYMEVTENSVALMWGASSHSLGIKKYWIFRDGIKIAETGQTNYLNSGLTANTEYRYTVKAVSQNDQISDAGNELLVRTKNTVNGNDQSYCGAEVYNPEKAYPTANTKVFYSCRIWVNKWYVNPNEIPGDNLAWEEVSACSESPECKNTQPVSYCGAQEYNPNRAYTNANTTVFYDCKIWKNKWYANPGEIPGKNDAWEWVSNCTEGPNCTTAISNRKLAQDIAVSVIVTNNVINLAPDSFYEKINEIQIFNTLGNKVFSSSKPTKNSMNISALPAGVYFVKILYSDGTSVNKTIKK